MQKIIQIDLKVVVVIYQVVKNNDDLFVVNNEVVVKIVDRISVKEKVRSVVMVIVTEEIYR